MSDKGKNVWDVLELLINKGAIFTLALLIFAGLILISAWRVPPEDLSKFWVFVGRISETHWFVSTLLLLASNLSWWVVHKNSKKLHEKEIDRLIALRSDLMHGKNTIINDHVSSENGNDSITMLTPTDKED